MIVILTLKMMTAAILAASRIRYALHVGYYGGERRRHFTIARNFVFAASFIRACRFLFRCRAEGVHFAQQRVIGRWALASPRRAVRGFALKSCARYLPFWAYFGALDAAAHLSPYRNFDFNSLICVSEGDFKDML